MGDVVAFCPYFLILKNIKYAQILSIKLNEFCQTYTPKS